MPRILRYLSHPQVEIDANMPVPMWQLSPIGRARIQAMDVSTLVHTRVLVSSAEVKAVQTAEILSDRLSIAFEQREDMHENDRSSTGFVPPDKFEKMADAFFGNPEKSVNGWERAVDAQARIVNAAIDVIASNPDGDILLVGHGAVGTLLYCRFFEMLISRIYDQPNGGGNFFSIDLDARKALHGWKPIEHIATENTDG